MTLHNFETYIDAQILKRGRDYIDQVDFLEEIEPDLWTATVSGSEDYEVGISLNGTDIQTVACECPHEVEYCKHVVAVLLNVREARLETAKMAAEAKKSPVKFEELLNQLSAEELRAFLRHYQTENRTFKQAFLFYFAEKDPYSDKGDIFKKQVAQISKKYSAHGFIDYRNTFGYVKEIQKLVNSAQHLIDQKKYTDALAAALVLIPATFEYLKNSDDSAGNMGGVVSLSVSLLEAAASQPTASADLKRQVFHHVAQWLRSSQDWFDYGDTGYDLLNMVTPIGTLYEPVQFGALLDDLIAAAKKEKYGEYQMETITRIKIKFLKETGNAQTAEALRRESIGDPNVRRSFIVEALQEKDYEEAKRLIKEGIQVAETKRHPGTVSQWEKELLSIAQLENDLPTIRAYSRQFALDLGRFNPEFYTIFKTTFSEAEWPIAVAELLDDLIGEGAKAKKLPYNFKAAAQILIVEQDWAKLANSLPPTLSVYDLALVLPYLKKDYAALLTDKYLKLIQAKGDQASDRGAYQELAALMQKVKQELPSAVPAIDALARDFIQKYAHRPAMVVELNRVLK